MKILEQLRKLISVRDHPSTPEGEVMAAAQAVTRLLYKYNLEEKDIPEAEKEMNPMVCEEINYKSPYIGGNWYSSLVAVITNNNLCKVLIVKLPSSTGLRMVKSRFRLVGRKNNVELVKYMIEHYTNRFYSIGKTKYKSYDGNLTENKFLRSFLEGCASGLNYKYKELQQQYVESTALIVSTKSEIDDFLKGTDIRKGTKSKEQFNSSVFANGFEVGKNIELHKGVNGEHMHKLSIR